MTHAVAAEKELCDNDFEEDFELMTKKPSKKHMNNDDSATNEASDFSDELSEDDHNDVQDDNSLEESEIENIDEEEFETMSSEDDEQVMPNTHNIEEENQPNKGM